MDPEGRSDGSTGGTGGTGGTAECSGAKARRPFALPIGVGIENAFAVGSLPIPTCGSHHTLTVAEECVAGRHASGSQKGGFAVGTLRG